ncbi:hypothetical protein Tco_0067382 [Tanacetum coccineum]
MSNTSSGMTPLLVQQSVAGSNDPAGVCTRKKLFDILKELIAHNGPTGVDDLRWHKVSTAKSLGCGAIAGRARKPIIGGWQCVSECILLVANDQFCKESCLNMGDSTHNVSRTV